MLSQTESVPDISTRSQGQVLLDLPEGVPPLSTLYLYIAGSCNLACRHCWISPNFVPGGNGGQFIKLEHIRKVIKQALSLGLQSVKLTGGEPLLHPHIREIVSLAAEGGLDITIETNGTLVDADLAAFLKASSHVSFISVSLDGASAATHEALRIVSGSYQKAIDGVHNLVAAGFRPQIICTLYQGNTAELTQVVSLAESLGCGSVKFNILQNMGRAEKMVQDLGIEVPEVLQLNRYIEHEIIPSCKIPVHIDVPLAFYSIRKLLGGNLGTCHIKSILGVLAGGELSLCGVGVTMPELIFGNIEVDALRDIWYNNPVLQQIRVQVPGKFEGICGECMHRDTCQGACIANNYHQTKRLNSAYRFCDVAEGLGLFPATRKADSLSH